MSESTHSANVATVARNATLDDLVELLKAQHDVKFDAAVPAQAIRSTQGVLLVAGMGPDGPHGEPGVFRPTEIADGHLADKLGIPTPYLRTLRNERVDIYDANVNGWLQGPAGGDPDGRNFLARTFRPLQPSGEGIFRALQSDRFARLDNLDFLVAALQGVQEADAEVEVIACDLSERGMRMRVAAPGVRALAPVLLDRYRAPEVSDRLAQTYAQRQRWGATDEPVVWGGFDLSNSETGHGAVSVCPVFTVPVCRNGMKITTDALRRTHLGGQLDQGIVRWSDETQQRNVELVTSMARDAVTTFLDADYVAMALEPIEERAGKRLKNPAETVKVVANQLRFSDAVAEGVLAHFISGGQDTAGGILNALTSFAQTVESPDLADELESEALRALEIAAA